MEIYLSLFLSFVKIGLFGFGGGYAMLPLIQNEVVAAPHNWISLADFYDIVAISQMTPGPIAINMATYVGYTVTDNVWGSLLATFGVCILPFIIMLILSKFYLKFKGNIYLDSVFIGLRPAIIGLVSAVAISMINKHNFIDIYSVVIFLGVFYATWHKYSPIKLILISGIAGMIIY